MTDLEKAAQRFHEAHRAAQKAQAVQDRAFKAQAQDPSITTTLAWVDAVKAQRMAVAVRSVALSALAEAALLVPEVF
jgi:hypothetical protein